MKKEKVEYIEEYPDYYQSCDIDDFNEQFQTDLSDEEFDTLGGIVMHEFGSLPKRGEHVEIGNLTIEILHADNSRIRLLQIKQSSYKESFI